MKTIIAIVAVVIIEALAISHGINGTMLGLALVLIAGLGGYHLKKLPWIK